MALGDQWRELEADLPDGWNEARLRLLLADDGAAGRAAALLAPLNPWRTGRELRVVVVRGGAGAGPDAARRAFKRLDRERIGGALDLLGAEAPPAAPEPVRPALAETWDTARATLPPDWSDLYLELELDSSRDLGRAALDLSPLNPRRTGDGPLLRFRAASRFGYGASPGMVRRCLERCDRDELRGDLRVVRVLSDTFPVATQGPVWQIDGRTV
jgi:hypothetical protein